MEKNDFDKIGKIHFIGIGGIGLSAIAKLMLAQGKIVSGSDANDSEILEDLRRRGAKIFIGQKSGNLAGDTELVIYTLAIPASNPERAKAEKMALPMLAYPEALGILFNEKYGIAVCGTHGKSTTTSMVSLVLAGAGLDPSVVVGSKVPEFDGNLRVGHSQYFVIEACEYERAFFEYFPNIIVLNNIELDHTDYYKDIEDYTNAYIDFINHLSNDGVLIYNGDDGQAESIKLKVESQNSNVKIISFGFREGNDIQGYNLEIVEGKTKFKVKYKNKKLGLPREIPLRGNPESLGIISLGEFELKLPGKFNVYNALAAIAAGLHLGIDAEKIKKSLADFGGIWRRFEVKGEYKNAVVISDYAHHPTAVRSTIEAAREFYPGKRILAVFQPHQHNRTKRLYQDFLKSFNSADILILAEIFDVAGREEEKDQNVSSKGMVKDIKSVVLRERSESKDPADNKIKKSVSLQPDNIFYAASLAETRKLIDEKIKPGDILLIMGAGDIYKVADDLAKK